MFSVYESFFLCGDGIGDSESTDIEKRQAFKFDGFCLMMSSGPGQLK